MNELGAERKRPPLEAWQLTELRHLREENKRLLNSLYDQLCLERDFGTLAKFAINEQWDNVRLLIAKLSRKYRKSHPELADTLNAALRERQDRSWILR